MEPAFAARRGAYRHPGGLDARDGSLWAGCKPGGVLLFRWCSIECMIKCCPPRRRKGRPMRLTAVCKRIIATDTGILILSALSVVALHTATNGQYGFHRDELATLDDARFLGWGYVVYPPVTPFIARVSLTLFGASMIGLRFFAALAVGIAMVLTGLMAREIGGGRRAQLVAAWAAVIAGPAVSFGYLFQYVSFDYLCWVVAAWVTIRLLRSEDQRWWLALGAAVGLGMMTKFTMAFLLVGIVGGIVLTRPR